MMKMKDFFKKLFCYIPKTAFAFALIGILAFFLHMSALLFPAVADALSESVGALLRATLACLTALFPFSLAEVLLLGLPLWIVLSVLIVRRALKKRASPIRIIALFLSFLPLLYALFVFTIGLGYATTPLAKKLELSPPSRPTSKELASTALWLAQRAEEEIPYITFDEEGKSVMPLSYGEMNRALYEAFASLKENEMPHLQNYPVGTKAVLLCRPMS